MPLQVGKRQIGSTTRGTVEPNLTLPPHSGMHGPEQIKLFQIPMFPSTTVTDKRWYITTNILGNPFQALIDTGAMITFISDDVTQHLISKGIHPEPLDIQVHLANDIQIRVNEKFTFPCIVGESETYLTAVHINHLTCSIVLGIDDITRLNLIRINGKENPTSDFRKIKPGIATITSLSREEEEKLQTFLTSQLPKFDKCLGKTTLVEHKIKLKSTEPLKQRYYPRNPAMQEIMKNEVKEMLNDDIIEPSSSPGVPP